MMLTAVESELQLPCRTGDSAVCAMYMFGVGHPAERAGKKMYMEWFRLIWELNLTTNIGICHCVMIYMCTFVLALSHTQY